MVNPKDPREQRPSALGEEGASEWERRVTGLLPARGARDPDAALRVIVKVARAGYLPDGVKERARLGPDLLTGETTWRLLEGIASDPLVLSVAIAEAVRPAK